MLQSCTKSDISIKLVANSQQVVLNFLTTLDKQCERKLMADLLQLVRFLRVHVVQNSKPNCKTQINPGWFTVQLNTANLYEFRSMLKACPVLFDLVGNFIQVKIISNALHNIVNFP